MTDASKTPVFSLPAVSLAFVIGATGWLERSEPTRPPRTMRFRHFDWAERDTLRHAQQATQPAEVQRSRKWLQRGTESDTKRGGQLERTADAG